MTIVAEKYATALQRVHISLPTSLVQELLDLLSELKDAGKVRRTEDGKQFSILDFIGNIVGKGNARDSWKRLQDNHPGFCVGWCDTKTFPGKGGYQGTPVTTEFGILWLAYLLPGALGDRLRKASANLVLESVSSLKGGFQSLLDKEPDQPEVEQSRQRIAELEVQVAEFKAKEEAIAAMTDASRFDFPLKAATQVSGHRRYYNTRTRVLSYLIEGIDYFMDGEEVWLSNPAYYAFVTASRTTDGIDLSVLKNFVHLRWDFYCRMCQAVRKPVNALYAQKRNVSKQMHPENDPTIPGFTR